MTEAQERYFQRGTILVGMHKEKTHSKGLIERFEFEWREVADDPARMSHLVPGRGKGSTRNRERSCVKSKAEDRARSPISSIPFSRQTRQRSDSALISNFIVRRERERAVRLIASSISSLSDF